MKPPTGNSFKHIVHNIFNRLRLLLPKLVSSSEFIESIFSNKLFNRRQKISVTNWIMLSFSHPSAITSRLDGIILFTRIYLSCLNCKITIEEPFMKSGGFVSPSLKRQGVR